MNESYTEHLIKRKTPPYAPLITGVMIFLTLICTYLALTTNVFAVALMFVSGFLTYIVHRNSKVEYEYLFVNNQLTIDTILGKSKRVKSWEGTMEQVEVIAPSDHYTLKDHSGTNRKKLDFSSQTGARTYTIMYQSNGTKQEIIIEPSENLLKCFRQTAPRKLIQ